MCLKCSYVEEQLQTTHSDAPVLTAGEQEQVKAGARWLRRVANPFVDFHTIVTVGTAVSSAVTNATQNQADPDVQGNLKDLYVWTAHSGGRQLTANLSQHTHPA